MTLLRDLCPADLPSTPKGLFFSTFHLAILVTSTPTHMVGEETQ
jgi:hypothetical protein